MDTCVHTRYATVLATFNAVRQIYTDDTFRTIINYEFQIKTTHLPSPHVVTCLDRTHAHHVILQIYTQLFYFIIHYHTHTHTPLTKKQLLVSSDVYPSGNSPEDNCDVSGNTRVGSMSRNRSRMIITRRRQQRTRGARPAGFGTHFSSDLRTRGLFNFGIILIDWSD